MCPGEASDAYTHGGLARPSHGQRLIGEGEYGTRSKSGKAKVGDEVASKSGNRENVGGHRVGTRQEPWILWALGSLMVGLPRARPEGQSIHLQKKKHHVVGL